MKIQEKTIGPIIAVLGVLVVIALALLGLAFFQLQQSAEKLNHEQQSQTRSFLLVNELRQSSNDLTRMVRSYVSTGNPVFKRQYQSVLGIRSGDIARPEDYHRIYWDLVGDGETKPRADSKVIKPLKELFREEGFTKEELEKVAVAEANSNKLVEAEVRAMNATEGRFQGPDGNYSRIDAPDRIMAANLVFGPEYHQEKAKVMAPLNDFFELVETRTAAAVDAALRAEIVAGYLFIGTLVFALTVIALLAFFWRMRNRLELARRTEAQAKAEAENEQLNDSVISILQAVNQISQRDLTVQAPVTEDVIGTVSDSINALTNETARVLHGVTNIAGQVAVVSGNVKTQAEQVTRTAEEERQNVGQMVESLLDATQTMNQVAALAEQSNESAEQATQVTDNALGTVNDTVKGMESIRETIAETEKRIKRLGERSQEISGIVNLINTISERTHVLALNASMQAAVAGEAGRGFAVVAEEVQRLAESSRNATQQIATLVNNIQIETNETINTVNRTIGQVVDGSEQAQRAGEQMKLTQQITNQLVSQVRSISDASNRQKEMSANLLSAVQQIGESTEQTAQQIEMQNRETQTLQQAAAQLVESVGVFKLPQQTA